MKNINYKEEYKLLHDRGMYDGHRTLDHKDRILNIVKETGSKTILDYGSGKGTQYSTHRLDEYWNSLVDCYDPYVDKFSVLQNKNYDGVISIDVLEHIPEEDLENAMATIFSKSKKFVYLCIHIGKAKKKFSDGTNVHVTIKPRKFWIDLANKYNINNVKLVMVFCEI